MLELGDGSSNLENLNHFERSSDQEFLDDIRSNPDLAWIESTLLSSLKKLNGEAFLAPENQSRIDSYIAENAREIVARLHLDPLTGLLNKDGFKSQTEKLMRISDLGAMILTDLDGFKLVNDNHGHHVGDELLRNYAALLKKFTRAGDLKARESGDECSIYASVPQVIAGLITNRIQRNTPALFEASQVSSSIGMAFAKPGDTYKSLHARAELALAWSKAQGKNRTTVIYDIGQHDKKSAFQFTDPNQPPQTSLSVYSVLDGQPPHRDDRKH